MRFEVACDVAAPPERVWAWWTDFGKPGDVLRVRHGLGSSTRRILEVEPGLVVFEDESLLGRIRRTVRVDGERTFLETGEGGQAFESRWTFEDAGGGRTRIVRAMRVRAHPAYGPFTRWLTAHDLRHHCREAERDLTASR